MTRTKAPDEPQLALFDAPAPSWVPAAPPPAELLRLAADLPPSLRFGTSSWSYPGWTGTVYGHLAGRVATTSELAWRGLNAYASHPLLGAVGIDRSYYAPVPEGDFASYRAQFEAAGRPIPARYLVKVGKDITLPWGRSGKNPHFLNADLAIAGWLAPAEAGLGPGVIHLLQLSPMGKAAGGPARFAERLHRFLDAVRPHGRVAVELRDAALLGPEYVATLIATGALHCTNLLPEMPGPAEQVATLQAHGIVAGAPLLIRWLRSGSLDHEAAEKLYDPYDVLQAPQPALIAETASTIAQSLAAGSPEVTVIIDNKAEGSAPLTVARLAERYADIDGH
ncbi:MAG: DUF72 domain-containing protein [Myxococcales bacterium]|nr:DUF72 domain-containing protein [Myxococcales bacterium]